MPPDLSSGAKGDRMSEVQRVGGLTYYVHEGGGGCIVWSNESWLNRSKDTNENITSP